MWISPFSITRSRYPHVYKLCLTLAHLCTVSTDDLLNTAVDFRDRLLFPWKVAGTSSLRTGVCT